MLDCRKTRLPNQTCPDNWVVLEPRHPRLSDRYGVSENDTCAFRSLRTSLANFGINLLDVVVFDQECHWWSLHELTSGTTAWTFATAPHKDPMAYRRALQAKGQI